MANLPPTKSQSDPLDGGNPVMLTRSTAQRMAESTRYFERQFRGTGAGPTASRSDAIRSIMTVKTTGAGIPHASANGTPHFEDCYLCEWNGTNWVPTARLLSVGNPSTANDVAPNRFITATYNGPILQALDYC